MNIEKILLYGYAGLKIAAFMWIVNICLNADLQTIRYGLAVTIPLAFMNMTKGIENGIAEKIRRDTEDAKKERQSEIKS